MCFCLYEEESHHIGEDITSGRLAEVAVKGVDYVGHHHMETVQNKRKFSFWKMEF